MKLSFLGKSYEPASPAIEAIATGETATFMGKPYARKAYTVEQPQPLQEAVIFLGQRSQPMGPACPLPRPGERVGNARAMIQLQRSRAAGRRHPAFR